MSERAARAAIAGAALGMLAGFGATTLGAQSVREYERKVDLLAVDARNADLALVEYRKLADEQAKLRDTVRAGQLLVVTSPDIAPLVRAAADRAFTTLQSQVGSATSRLGAHVFFAQPDRQHSADEALSILTGERDARGLAYSESWHNAVADDLARALAEMGLRAIGVGTERSFRVWSSEALPTDSMSAIGWSAMRVAMVSSPVTVVRRCYDRDLAACRVALGLTETADPVVDWYDASDRRRLVVRSLGERSSDVIYPIPSTTVSASCVAGNDDACIATLRRTGYLPTPFAAVNRASLMRQAMAIGGPGAMERMLTATGGRPDDHLAAAAGVPIDAVLSAWQHNVHDTRVPSDNMSPRMALMSAAWILVFGGLSLRSPRWR